MRPSIAATRLPEMKHDAVRFVQRLDEPADLGAHDPLERDCVRARRRRRRSARAQRRGDLQPDEAGADDDDVLRRLRRAATIARLSANERR